MVPGAFFRVPSPCFELTLPLTILPGLLLPGERERLMKHWFLSFLIWLCPAGNLLFAQAASADIVIVGATPGGIMAGVAAARLGSRVVILEPTDHVGGIMSNGLTKCDIINKKAIGGLFTEFTQTLHQYYKTKYGIGSPQEKACKEGFESEPHVVELVFQQFIEKHPNISVRFHRRLKKTVKAGNRLTEVVTEVLNEPGKEESYKAKVFIDATYEGDLFAGAGAAYAVGRESRYEYGERQAGKIYSRFGYDELLPGSTGEGDKAVQAYCFRMNMTKTPENRVPVVRPEVYDRNDYLVLLDDIKAGLLSVSPRPNTTSPVQFMPKPNGKFEINSNHPHPVLGAPKISLDWPEENMAYPEAGYAEREKIIERYKNYHIGFLWFMQNDPEVPEDFRKEMSEYGFSKDEYVTNNHFPRQLYIREGRRLRGAYIFTQHEDEMVPGLMRTRIHPTSIAIAEYPWDCHGCSRYDPRHPGVREGYFYVEHAPMQIPYEVMVPEKVDGLLVPVAVSCSHVGQQTLRMEPGFMAYGQAAGVAAHLSIKANVTPRHVPIGAVQKELAKQKAIVAYFDDITADDPDYELFQYLGARGLNTGYSALPDQTLSRAEAIASLKRISEYAGIKWNIPSGGPEGDVTNGDLQQWLKTSATGAAAGETISRRQFVKSVYQAVNKKY